MKAYLDNAATAISYPLASFPLKEAFIGNPSSLHTIGVGSAQVLSDTKRILCDAFGGKNYNYVFTSGATESANLAIKGAAKNLVDRKIPRNEIIVSQIEHPAVYETVFSLKELGFKPIVAPVNKLGFVEPNTVASLLTDKTAMVCVMAVNNETGVVQPINDIFNIVKKANPKIITVCDTVQALCKGFTVPLSVTDIFFGSGHKFGGINGAGFLYLNESVFITPLFHGGGQQYGLRCGTENPFAISCMGYAIQSELNSDHCEKVKALGSVLLDALPAHGVEYSVHGIEGKKTDYIYSIHFHGIDSAEAFTFLNSKGICVSRGSACSSSDTKQSRVLTAMGLSPEVISQTLRVSLSPFTTKEEILYFCGCMEMLVNKVK